MVERRRSRVRRKGVERRPATAISQDVPEGIQDAIEHQRGELALAIILLRCLHCVIRQSDNNDGVNEGVGLDGAAGWADLGSVTALLMVRLNAVHLVLDSVSLQNAMKV